MKSKLPPRNSGRLKLRVGDRVKYAPTTPKMAAEAPRVAERYALERTFRVRELR